MDKWFRNAFFFLVLITSDLVSFYASLTLSYFTRLMLNPLLKEKVVFTFPLSHFLSMWWMPLIFIFFLFYEGLYTKRYTFPEDLRRLFKVVFLGVASVFFLVGVTKKSEEVSRLMIFMLGMYMYPVLTLLRYISKKLLFRWKFGVRRFVVIGMDSIVQKAASFLDAEKMLGYRLVGFFSDRDAFKRVNINGRSFVVRRLRSMDRILEKKLADCVVISAGFFEAGELTEFVSKLQRKADEVIIVPPFKSMSVVNSEHLPVYMLDVFLLRFKDNLKSSVNAFIKRSFDMLLSLTLLPVALTTILIIAILIKLETGGPVFFSHLRLGQGGRKIKVYKFRTMYKNSDAYLKRLLQEREDIRTEWEKYRKLKDDPRVTKIGKFLRRTSLDELPQIFNVLKGEMSLVGPRPVTQEELERYYGDLAEIYKLVKPGITGYWQVSGRNDVDYETRVAMDTFYILNWSLWLDMYILLKTFFVILGRKGAY